MFLGGPFCVQQFDDFGKIGQVVPETTRDNLSRQPVIRHSPVVIPQSRVTGLAFPN